MEDTHILRYYGGYSFLDVLEMTLKERNIFIDKLKAQLKLEDKLAKKHFSK